MYVSIEGQGHFYTIYNFQVLYVLCFTRPRYQVSVYRTIGPLVCNIRFPGQFYHLMYNNNNNNNVFILRG